MLDRKTTITASKYINRPHYEKYKSNQDKTTAKQGKKSDGHSSLDEDKP